jgi:hypothetical protein
VAKESGSRLLQIKLLQEMRKMKCFMVAIFVLIIATYCTNNHVIETVGIERIDTSGIYFSYEYLGKKHKGAFPLDLIKENFYSTDSLKIKIDKNNTDEFEFVSVVRRKWPKEESYIPIDTSKEKLSQYHGIDKKPLFKGVSDYEKNDSVVQEFLKKELIRVQQKIPGRIGLYLIIGKDGKASLGKVFGSDKTTENYLREIVDNMPLFESGEHKGEKVKVSYLVEIK